MIDKKKAMQTIMSKRNPQTGEVSSSPMAAQVSKSEDGEPDGRHAAAQDILAAMHERDPQKLMESLANFADLHTIAKDKMKESENEEDSE